MMIYVRQPSVTARHLVCLTLPLQKQWKTLLMVNLFKCPWRHLAISKIVPKKGAIDHIHQISLAIEARRGGKQTKWKGRNAWNWQWGAERLVTELWPVSRPHQSQRNGRPKRWIKHQTTWLWQRGTEWPWLWRKLSWDSEIKSSFTKSLGYCYCTNRGCWVRKQIMKELDSDLFIYSVLGRITPQPLFSLYITIIIQAFILKPHL